MVENTRILLLRIVGISLRDKVKMLYALDVLSGMKTLSIHTPLCVAPFPIANLQLSNSIVILHHAFFLHFRGD